MEQSNPTCCPVEDLTGKALTASVLSLDAVGPQEKYLNNNDSQFIPSFDRVHGNAIFQRNTQLGGASTKYFGNTVQHSFKTKEMGDLLGNMYLKTTAPILSENQSSSNVVLSFPSEYTQLINPGESYSILGSELRRIEFGSTDLKTLTGAANSYNDILSNMTLYGEHHQHQHLIYILYQEHMIY